MKIIKNVRRNGAISTVSLSKEAIEMIVTAERKVWAVFEGAKRFDTVISFEVEGVEVDDIPANRVSVTDNGEFIVEKRDGYLEHPTEPIPLMSFDYDRFLLWEGYDGTAHEWHEGLLLIEPSRARLVFANSLNEAKSIFKQLFSTIKKI